MLWVAGLPCWGKGSIFESFQGRKGGSSVVDGEKCEQNAAPVCVCEPHCRLTHSTKSRAESRESHNTRW
jgi:hypothetical protein